MAKFFITNDNFKEDIAYISGNDAHHLQNVLRKNIGDKLEIAACGMSYEAEIAELERDRVKLNVLQALNVDKEASLKVYLLLGISKGEKMDWIVEKATELGVYAIIPIMLQRCVVQLDKSGVKKKQERWQRLAEAASKQCRRSHIPEVFAPCKLAEALNIIKDIPCLTLWENEQEMAYKKALHQINGDSIALVLGAEGGIDYDEIAILRENGARTVTVGSRILRAETAAITALAICMYELADLGGGV